MRLNKNNKGAFVGPASCVAAAGLIVAGMLCPQVYNTHATEGVSAPDSPTTAFSFEVDRLLMDGLEKTKDVNLEFEVDRTMIDGQEKNKNVDVLFNVVGFGRETKTVDVEFEVLEYLQITKGNNFSLNMGEVASGTSSKTDSFTVAGNNAAGFGVYVYVPTGKSVNMQAATNGQTGGNNAVISQMSLTEAQEQAGGVALDAIGNDSWGYSLNTAGTAEGSRLFKPVLSQADAIVSGPVKQINRPGKLELDITCGAKVAETPADTYSTDVVLAAVAPFNATLVGDEPANP